MKEMKGQKQTRRLVYLIPLIIILVLLLIIAFIGYSKITGLPTLTTQDTTICAPNTYYIDYVTGNDTNNGTCSTSAWKRVPGMTGFVGTYTHRAGDSFIFKGGVTWPASALPLTIRYSGNATNIDTYTVDKNWYSGASWSYPVFDGQQSLGANNFLIGDDCTIQSNIIIDSLRLQNIGNPSDSSGTSVFFCGGSNLTIRNSWLQPEGIQAFAYGTNGRNASSFYVYNNHISRAGRVVIYGWTGEKINDVEIYNNTFDGAGNTDSGGYHTDGFMIGNPIGSECAATNGTPTVTNVLFYNNLFDGDWSGGATAEWYSNGCTSGTTIYNNVFSFENCTTPGNVCFSPALVFFGQHDQNINIYDNTFSNDAYPGYGVGASLALIIADPTGAGNVVIKNNIFSGFGNTVAYENVTNITIDHNLYNEAAPGSGRLIWGGTSGAPWECHTLVECQAKGMELNSPALADPKFVSISNGTIGSANWNIRNDSPAIDQGINLGSQYNTDIRGVSRPQGAAWDIGAYEYTNGTLTSTNGQCGTSNNACATGTLNDIADNSTSYLWQCLGSNGGSSASCSLAIPSNPGNTGSNDGGGSGSSGTTKTATNTTNASIVTNASSNTGTNQTTQTAGQQTEATGNQGSGSLSKYSQLFSSIIPYLITFLIIIIVVVVISLIIISRRAKDARVRNEMFDQAAANFSNLTDTEAPR